MLEVRNLTKIYQPKKGAAVHALDGISLRFPQTGMVFLLGKSGSGKSTLLNVCGGLDAPSDGEIIVKGRSSKDFSQSDFDSYRNTFVGFIFQEYNILEEFSVEDNIALALELQGKPKDKAAIQALLKEVDLEGFSKRKPNTLSGGQKQRIAIARALVKSPEIIMADEPTGALDSSTGKQVLETLKKLSRDKLVIVVSHDRDFAEQYGDRIIELKDGKVISDVSKTQQQQQQLSANVNAVGDVLCIKRGKELTDSDFEQIKSFLKQSGDDVIIAAGEKDVQTFKKVSRIGDDGSKEVFRSTTEPAVRQYTEADSRFIRSKLPVRHAAKIGVSSLGSKPFRLTFTILLCTVAFVLFGLLSTLNFYNSHDTFVQTMANSSTPMLQMRKDYKVLNNWYNQGTLEHSYEGSAQGMFNDAELKEISTTLGADGFGVLSFSGSYNLRQGGSQYWDATIAGFGVLPARHPLRNTIIGAYPQKADELLISSYAANMFYNCKTYDSDGNVLEPTAPEEIIGKKIIINAFTYTISGVFDSGEIPMEFESLKESTDPNDSLARQFSTYLHDNLHLLAFVSDERLSAIYSSSGMYMEGIHNYTDATAAFRTDEGYEFPDWGNTRYITPSMMTGNAKIIPLSGSKTVPSNGEVMLSSIAFGSLAADAYRFYAESSYDYTVVESYYRMMDVAYEVMQNGFYTYDETTGKSDFTQFTKTQLEQKVNDLVAAVKRDGIDLRLGMKPFDTRNNAAIGDIREFQAISVYVASSGNHMGELVLSETDFYSIWDEQKLTVDYYNEVETLYTDASDAYYSRIFLPFTFSEATVESYWTLYDNEEYRPDDSLLVLTGSFIDNLRMVDNTVKELSRVFLYVGLILAVFAALLLSNFISASISQKTREIGILRAVGARSSDVFKIFFSESVVIAVICVALSTAASVLVCNYLNDELASGIGASLFVFGLGSFLILVAIAVVTVVVATFLPVQNAAKKKPVESIRAL